MIQTQQFEGFPVFGDNSSKSQPEAAIYSNGFAPADVLPAEYYNWLTNKASVGITDLNRGVNSVEEELNNVVIAGGETPTEETPDQVITAIKYLIAQAKSEAILAAHPVGSLYWSSKNTNPSQLFGGTWTQLKDKFILAAGDTYTNGATGGAATVTLTVNQIPSHTHTGPSHTHSFTPSGTVSSHSHTMSHTHSFTPSGTVSSHSHTGPSHTHSFTTSSNGSHNHRALVYTGEARTDVGNMYGFNTNSSAAHNYWCIAGQSAPQPWDASDDISVVNTTDIRTSGYARYANWGAKRNNSYKRQIIETAGAHTHTGTTAAAGTGNTGAATPTFTGKAGTTGASSAGNTGAATPTFTGTAGTTGAAGTGNTGSTGGGSSHNNMPPYIVKYCWERTA
jgi:hypothetical protein